MDKFFLTTPIYYVNARPHIGHAYTTLVADVLARWSRAEGVETFFLTGTDEHGQKIERSAQAAGVPPQQFADEVSAQFRTLWDRMGLTYDRYIRTTSPEHKRGVQKLFSTLYERNFIYLSTYTGSYCVSDEAFVDLPAGSPCPDCGRTLETVTEENFFFKLSEFQRPLLDLIESDTLRIEPEGARNEVLSFLRGAVPSAADAGPALAGEHLTAQGTPYQPGALKDLSISRSSFTWGVEVPEPAASAAAQKHVIYVWLDALANYMTALGYGAESAEGEAEWVRFWPANLHLVGKEITRFHCVYWPAFLLAAGLPTPRRIAANGWLLFDNSKMSKSKGNVVRTETILDAFGGELYAKQFPDASKEEQDHFAADVLRYYLLREIPFGQDGSFSFDALVTRYTADLANGYGNLVSRALKMILNFNEGKVPLYVKPSAGEEMPEHAQRCFFGPQGGPARTVQSDARHSGARPGFSVGPLEQAWRRDLSAHAFSQGLEGVWGAIAGTDSYLSEHQPWKLAAGEERDRVLYTAAESIRIITALLSPILPFATASVWRQLGLGDIKEAARSGKLKDLHWGDLRPGTTLGPLAPIFPRADKGLAQIMNDMESTQRTPAAAEPEPIECITGPNDPATARTGTSTPELGAITTQHDASTPATDDLPVTSLASAGPRTATLTPEPNPGAQVAGSAAPTTERPDTPSHAQAPASGIFAGAPADSSPQITIDDFAKVELRVAQVLVCERIPKADKLLRLEVDLGFERRQILSGIAEWYTPEELLGRRIVVITNLAPRKMRGLESHGMLLAASSDGGKPYLATFGEGAEALPLGSRLK